MIPSAILIALAVAVLAAIIDTRLMRWCCARGLAHADGLDSYRAQKRSRRAHWDAELAGGGE